MNQDQAAQTPIGVIDRALSRLNTVVVCVLFVLLTACVLWGVGTRFVLGDQARWTEEAARFLLVWVTLLGGAMVYASHAHLGLDLVVRSMDSKSRAVCDRTSAALIYLFAIAVMIVGGSILLFERARFGQVMPSLGISRAWQYLALPIAGVLIAVSAVRAVLDHPGSEGSA